MKGDLWSALKALSKDVKVSEKRGLGPPRNLVDLGIGRVENGN